MLNIISGAARYKPEEFENTSLFQNYSPFCREVISVINEWLKKNNIKHMVLTRNGRDHKITFTIISPKKRNLLTLYPNKNLDYVYRVEIRDKENSPNPFFKKINNLNDLDEVFDRVHTLSEKIQR